MAGLLQYYFFPTDFYYPKPQPVNTTSQNQQQQEVVAVPPVLKIQKKQQLADDHDRDLILENKEKPFNALAIRTNKIQDNSKKLVLKSTFSMDCKLRKPDKNLTRAAMFEDYGL